MKLYWLLLLLALVHWTSALEAELTQTVKIKNNSFTCLLKIHYEGDTCFDDSTVSCSPNGKRKVAKQVELILEDGTVVNIKKLIMNKKKDKIVGCKATSPIIPITTQSIAEHSNGSVSCNFDDNELSRDGRSPVDPDSGYNWSGGKIPYYFTYSVTANDRNVIRRAMKQVHDNTCFRFEERNGEPSGHHLEIRVGSKTCWPYAQAVVKKLTRTKILLQSRYQLADQSRCNWEGLILHELMHVLGVMHMHKRKDRDNYVTVNYRNIAMRSQYDICWGCYTHTGYECSSIMHYGTKTFWNGRGATMTAKDTSSCRLGSYSPSVATATDWQLLNILGSKVCSVATTVTPNTTEEPATNSQVTTVVPKTTEEPTTTSQVTTVVPKTTEEPTTTSQVTTVVPKTTEEPATTSQGGSSCPYNDMFDKCPLWKDPYCNHEKWGVWMRTNCAKTCNCGECTTINNKRCVFPFIYQGVKYSRCTMKAAEKRWCATAVDSNGQYIRGRWGYCGSACS